MSLLLDALKRAEDAKRSKKNDGAGTESSQQSANLETANQSHSIATSSRESSPPSNSFAELSLAPIEEAAPSPAAETTSTRAMSSEAIQKSTSIPKHGGQSTKPVPANNGKDAIADKAATQDSIQRDAAKNVFVAKQNVQKNAITAKAKWVLPLVTVSIIGIAGGGWYVWNEINKTSRPALANLANAPRPALSALNLSANNDVSTKTTDVAPPELTLPPLLPPPAREIPLPKLVTVKLAATEVALTERELLAKRLQASGNVKSGKVTPLSLSVSPTIEPAKINSTLLAAYAELSKGNYNDAKKRYLDLTQTEPDNLDAQLGLATAAARMNGAGDRATAAIHYRRALEIDPRNNTAIAGLLAVSGEVSLEAMETELKTWVVKNPGSAPLQFSLGNLYAGQRRWTEAQQAYFEAYRIESANADYLYNLAVSLDQLGQAKLALNYYQMALGQQSKVGGQFDSAMVVRRIGELKAN